jgi:hypothetical protein
VFERLERHKVNEALRHEKAKRKLGKKLVERFGAEEGPEAILLNYPD